MADTAWATFIKLRDGCCVIGRSQEGFIDPCNGHLEAAHLISRAVLLHRHEPMNGITLCSKHHKWSNLLSAHATPLAFAEWLRLNHANHWEWHEHNKWKRASVKPDFKLAHEILTRRISEIKSS